MDKFFCISTFLLTVMGTLLAPAPVMGNLINDRTLIMSEGVWHSSPALADLDGDGKLEIVVGSITDNIYAWHCDGRLVDGWPQKAQWRIGGSPAVADLDGDGDMEVVAGGHVLGAAPFVLVVESQNRTTGLGMRYGTWLLERGFSPRYAHLGTTKIGSGGLWEHLAHQGIDPDSIIQTVWDLARVSSD